MRDARDGTPQRILDGVRVLDLTRYLSGPTATLFLAGLGAEVIKVDDPETGDPTLNAPPFLGPKGVALERQTPDDVGLYYLKRARAKKAISLNLKSDKGRALFLRLVKTADVLVENFRTGVAERLGIAYPQLRAVNPRLVYCAITGYGSTGPDRHAKAFDLMVQAATGLMSVTGDPDGRPCKAGTPLTDGIAGTFAVSGVLGALYQRERTGEGQFVDVSMADCLLSLMLDEPLDSYAALGLPERQGNRIMRLSPFNTYPARDGEVAIGAATRDDWVRLLAIIGRSDLLGDADFMNPSWRIVHNADVDALVIAWTRARTVDDIVAQLSAQDVPCSAVRDIGAVARWPHLRARGMLAPLVPPGDPVGDPADAGPLAPNFPLQFSDSPTGYDRPAPTAAQHNDEIYRDLLGLSERELADLAADGVI